MESPNVVALEKGDESVQRGSLDTAFDMIRLNAQELVVLTSWKRTVEDRLLSLEAGQRTAESAQARLEGTVEGLRALMADVAATSHSTYAALMNLIEALAEHKKKDADEYAKQSRQAVDDHSQRAKMIVRYGYPLGVIAAALAGATAVWRGIFK